MRHRRPFGLGVLVGLMAAVIFAGGWPSLPILRAQVPFGAVRLMDGAHTQLARVDHVGSLAVTCMTAAGVAESCAGAGGASDAVNVFHQSTIRHISSASHVVGAVRLMGSTPNDQLVVVTHSGALTITCQTAAGVAESCAGGGGAGDAVNVFHQSTVRHISSVTHVTGYGAFHMQGLGTPGQSHGGVVSIQGAGVAMNPVLVSPSNVVNTTAWLVNIQHLSSQLHVGGSVRLEGVRCPTCWAVISHSGAQLVDAQQSGTWTVQPGNTPNTTAWLVNVQHISSVLHVAFATHSGAAVGAIFHVRAIESPAQTRAVYTNVTPSATDVDLLGANHARVTLVVYHHCGACTGTAGNTSNLFLLLSDSLIVSTTQFTVLIPANSYWELRGPMYTGRVRGIWTDNLTGAARITELTR